MNETTKVMLEFLWVPTLGLVSWLSVKIMHINRHYVSREELNGAVNSLRGEITRLEDKVERGFQRTHERLDSMFEWKAGD